MEERRLRLTHRLFLRWIGRIRGPSQFRSVDGPQWLIIRDGIELHAYPFSTRAQGEHRCQRVHLLGGVEIGPDAYIDDSIGDRINGDMIRDSRYVGFLLRSKHATRRTKSEREEVSIGQTR